MGALTIRNLPEDIHEQLRRLAAKHGRSTEAEVRTLIIDAVTPKNRIKPGNAMSEIWRKTGITAEEAAAIENARTTEAAKPMNLA